MLLKLAFSLKSNKQQQENKMIYQKVFAVVNNVEGNERMQEDLNTLPLEV